jgi:hypothetical protein
MRHDVSYDNEYAQRLKVIADKFVRSPEFDAALNGLRLDQERRASAISSPEKFLSDVGLSFVDGLGFDLFEEPPRFFPFPDWTPWIIELTSCFKDYAWVCDDLPGPSGFKRCQYRERETCLGFHIYPRPWPRGPFTI